MNKYIIAFVLFVMMVFGTVAPAAACVRHNPEPHKWYVCKYVGKPGVDERLQTGQNPIFVDGHSIATFPDIHVGDWFNDAQGRSYVLAGPYIHKLTPEPDVSQCPPASPGLDATAFVGTTPPDCDSAGSATYGVEHARLVGDFETGIGSWVAHFMADTGHAFADGSTTLDIAYEVAGPTGDCPVTVQKNAVLKIKKFTGCVKPRRALEVVKRHNIASLVIKHNDKRTHWVVKAHTKPNTLMRSGKHGGGTWVNHVRWTFNTPVPSVCSPHPHTS